MIDLVISNGNVFVWSAEGIFILFLFLSNFNCLLIIKNLFYFRLADTEKRTPYNWSDNWMPTHTSPARNNARITSDDSTRRSNYIAGK